MSIEICLMNGHEAGIAWAAVEASHGLLVRYSFGKEDRINRQQNTLNNTKNNV